jgi:putative transposase
VAEHFKPLNRDDLSLRFAPAEIVHRRAKKLRQGDLLVRKSRFSESQVVAILKEHDAGVATAELARKHGIHANTLRLWRAKYGGMDAAELARLRQLEDENARMRRIIANQSLEIDAMKNVISKNGWGPHNGKAR